MFDFDPKWIPPFQFHNRLLAFVSPKIPSWLYTQSSLNNLTLWHSRASFEPLNKLWKFATQLEFFFLTNNSINDDMSNVLLNSQIVWLTNNNLRGGVLQLSLNVTLLALGSNSLSRSISLLLCHKMKQTSNLEYLDISNNILSRGIPNCWMDWKSLLHVHLGNNNFTGKFPHSMGSLSNLISLNLHSNNLSKELPLSL